MEPDYTDSFAARPETRKKRGETGRPGVDFKPIQAPFRLTAKTARNYTKRPEVKAPPSRRRLQEEPQDVRPAGLAAFALEVETLDKAVIKRRPGVNRPALKSIDGRRLRALAVAYTRLRGNARRIALHATTTSAPNPQSGRLTFVARIPTMMWSSAEISSGGPSAYSGFRARVDPE